MPGVVAAGSASHLPYDNLPNWGGPYITQPEREAFSRAFNRGARKDRRESGVIGIPELCVVVG